MELKIGRLNEEGRIYGNQNRIRVGWSLKPRKTALCASDRLTDKLIIDLKNRMCMTEIETKE